MIDVKALLELPSNSPINWGEVARDVLTPAQKAVYEQHRAPAWQEYQAAVAEHGDKHWTEAVKIMPQYWEAYRIKVRHAFATAYASPAFPAMNEAMARVEKTLHEARAA